MNLFRTIAWAVVWVPLAALAGWAAVEAAAFDRAEATAVAPPAPEAPPVCSCVGAPRCPDAVVVLGHAEADHHGWACPAPQVLAVESVGGQLLAACRCARASDGGVR